MNRDGPTDRHLTRAIKTLENAEIPQPRNEIDHIICNFFSVPRHRAVIGDFRLTCEQWDHFHEIIEQRGRHVPLQYILKSCSFWKREFIVTPDVLIPRPETEHLVETALNVLPPQGERIVVDCCTGSGCVALSLSLERPDLRVIGCDISPAALNVAKQNQTRLASDNCFFLATDLLASFPPSSVDFITANPPYVSEADAPSLQPELFYEPGIALFSEHDGLHHIRRILQQAPKILKKNGGLAFEFGYNQGDAIRKLVENDISGRIRQFNIIKDLNGHERIGFLNYA